MRLGHRRGIRRWACAGASFGAAARRLGRRRPCRPSWGDPLDHEDVVGGLALGLAAHHHGGGLDRQVAQLGLHRRPRSGRRASAAPERGQIGVVRGVPVRGQLVGPAVHLGRRPAPCRRSPRGSAPAPCRRQQVGRGPAVDLRAAVAVLVGQVGEALPPGGELDPSPTARAACPPPVVQEQLGGLLAGQGRPGAEAPALLAHGRQQILQAAGQLGLPLGQPLGQRRQRPAGGRAPPRSAGSGAIDPVRLSPVEQAAGTRWPGRIWAGRRPGARPRAAARRSGSWRGRRRSPGWPGWAGRSRAPAPRRRALVAGVHGAHLGVRRRRGDLGRAARATAAPPPAQASASSAASWPATAGSWFAQIAYCASSVAPEDAQDAQPVGQRLAGARSRRRSGWGWAPRRRARPAARAEAITSRSKSKLSDRRAKRDAAPAPAGRIPGSRCGSRSGPGRR